MFNFDDIFKHEIPEKCGLTYNSIYNFINELNELELNIHSIIMIKNSKTIFEGYAKPFDKNTPHRMFSVTKSLVSIAIGFMQADGIINIDDYICPFFENKLPENTHKFIKETTIRDMLKMASPHDKTAYKKLGFADWVKSFFYAEPSHKPGTVFCYDTSASHVLTALVENLTGKSLIDYLREKFLDKIGFSKEAYCITDPIGVSQGGSGLVALPRDIALLAYSIINSDKLKKELNFSDEYIRYIKEATSKHIDTYIKGACIEEKQGYGFHFWRTRNNGFALYGMAGQIALCLPHHDFILVSTADTQEIKDGVQKIYDAFWRNIYSDMNKYNKKEISNFDELEIKKSISNLEKNMAIPFLISDNTYEKDINGIIFNICDDKKNICEIQNIKLTFKLDNNSNIGTGTINIKLKEKDFNLKFGFNQNVEDIFPFYQYKCISSAKWTDKHNFIIKTQIIDKEILSIYFQLGFSSNMKNGTLIVKKSGSGVDGFHDDNISIYNFEAI